MEIGEWEVSCDGHRVLESRFCLTGEPDHEIGSKPEVGNLGECRFNELAVGFDRMPPVHGSQDCVVAALQRDMKIGAKLF